MKPPSLGWKWQRVRREWAEQAAAWRDAVIMSRLSEGESVPLEKDFSGNGAVSATLPENAPACHAVIRLLEATGAETLVQPARPDRHGRTKRNIHHWPYFGLDVTRHEWSPWGRCLADSAITLRRRPPRL